MSHRERDRAESRRHADAGAEPRPKAPYVAPAVSWEEALPIESNLQSACAKLGPMGGACAAAPSS